MSTPQPGIFAQGTRSHRHIEFNVRAEVEATAVLEALHELGRPSMSTGGANIVLGFAPELWTSLTPGQAPATLKPFPTIAEVPATQHDIWLWVHGTGDDVLLDVARRIAAQLAPVADVVSEIPAFVYHDSRDLTGFIDGTENPSVEEACRVAIVGAAEPGAGGSFAITQRWVLDLTGFTR